MTDNPDNVLFPVSTYLLIPYDPSNQRRFDSCLENLYKSTWEESTMTGIRDQLAQSIFQQMDTQNLNIKKKERIKTMHFSFFLFCVSIAPPTWTTFSFSRGLGNRYREFRIISCSGGSHGKKQKSPHS